MAEISYNQNLIREHFERNTPYDKLAKVSANIKSISKDGVTKITEQSRKEIRNFLADLKKSINERVEKFDDEILDDLANERHYRERNCGADYMQSFLNKYNKEIIDEVEYYIKNLKSKLESSLSDSFAENEFKQLNLKESFEEWFFCFSDEEEYQEKRKLKWFSKYNTYLTPEENSNITSTVKLHYSNSDGEINYECYHLLPPNELIKVYEYNLNARFIKWREIANNPFVTEEQFLEAELKRFQLLKEENSLNIDVHNIAKTALRAREWAIANINCEIVEKKLNYFKSDVVSKKEELDANEQNTIKFHSLKEVFKKESDYTKAVDALKEIGVIDEENCNLVGPSLKGVMQVWYDVIHNKRELLKHITTEDLTVLLNKQFSNLDISEKSQGKHLRNPINKTASKKYKERLLELI
jgi:hypothetical protein